MNKSPSKSEIERNVKTIRFGILHYVAQCEICDWHDGGIDDVTRESVRQAARRHVGTTGHAVMITSGSETRYELKNKTKVNRG